MNGHIEGIGNGSCMGSGRRGVVVEVVAVAVAVAVAGCGVSLGCRCLRKKKTFMRALALQSSIGNRGSALIWFAKRLLPSHALALFYGGMLFSRGRKLLL